MYTVSFPLGGSSLDIVPFLGYLLDNVYVSESYAYGETEDERLARKFVEAFGGIAFDGVGPAITRD